MPITHSLAGDRRVIALVILILLALSLVAWRGLHFGIEFEGGTRLPLTLERPVDAETMDEVIGVLKTRLAKFGLAQVVVRGVGASEIYVEVPKGDPSFIHEVEKIVREVGKFEGIIDGRVAVSGEDIIPGSIQDEPTIQGNRITWAVGFAITQESVAKFAAAAKGKADYPVYMFLDRPDDAIVIIEREILLNQSVAEEAALAALERAVRKENTTIPIFVLGDWEEMRPRIANLTRTNETRAIVSESLPAHIIAELRAMGFVISNKTRAEMSPEFQTTEQGIEVEAWPAVGLLSAPRLNKNLASGVVGQLYQISGPSRGITLDEQRAYALLQMKKLRSILSGGALPVRVIMGSTTTIPAPLGAEFLRYSIVGALAALVGIVILVSVRYRAPKIILPIILISIAELTILVSIVGSIGTIDLSAMAGIIAALGVSVDAQIVITDEILKREEMSEAGTRRRLGRAFQIITTNATIAAVAMLPLLFSGLVEIVGFATSTVLGYLLGVGISRPAYAALVEHIFGTEEE
ncbi:MAG: hypothetical protein QXG98_03855 [Candidatus Micrarchaeia archaeon]